MKFSLLSWNVQKKEMSDNLIALANEHKPSAIVVMEGQGLSRERLEANGFKFIDDLLTSQLGKPIVELIVPPCSAFEISALQQEPRYRVFRLKLGQTEVLIFGVHLRSPRDYSLEDRNQNAQELALKIQALEATRKSNHTIVIGDFNLNPYDSGIARRLALHATGCRAEAQRLNGRDDTRASRRPFYNPVWNRFGDEDGPPGTFYYNKEEPRWNMFDQALLRPELISWFSKLEIITEIAGTGLATKNQIPKKSHSDHFPIHLILDVPNDQ